MSKTQKENENNSTIETVKKDKVVLLDWGIFSHRAIFAWRNNKAVPPTYTCLNMILASLRRIGIDPADTVLIACDGRHSWRKDVDSQYKANRKEFRESYEDIDWKKMYSDFDYLLARLDMGTDWHVLKADGLEADDWMAVACRYFEDKEVVLVTYDADMEQLTHYSHVKVFSPLIKIKGGKGGYKIVKNPLKTLAKKIDKEVADNLVNPILSEEDYNRRKMIVSLLELPEFVEEKCKQEFEKLYIKGMDLNAIPFRTLRDKLGKIYEDKSNIVTFDDCVKNAEKKKAKEKKKRRKS